MRLFNEAEEGIGTFTLSASLPPSQQRYPAVIFGFKEQIDLDVVERERTPEPAMVLGIQSNYAGLSLSKAESSVRMIGCVYVSR